MVIGPHGMLGRLAGPGFCVAETFLINRSKEFCMLLGIGGR